MRRLRKELKQKNHNRSSCKNSLSGPEAENLACQYLLNQGLILLARNFRTRYGEIDIIMRDNEQLVFVEVRFRQSSAYGSAEESITQLKCRRLEAAAQFYIQQRGHGIDTAGRFDAIALHPNSDCPTGFSINWIKNILVC